MERLDQLLEKGKLNFQKKKAEKTEAPVKKKIKTKKPQLNAYKLRKG
jgi:hypothetical protein